MRWTFVLILSLLFQVASLAVTPEDMAEELAAEVTVEQLVELTDSGPKDFKDRRDAIVALGESCLPALDRIYEDTNQVWKARFAAGVCIEHIRRAKDIEEMLHYDWWSVPGFYNGGPILATGYPPNCEPVVWEKLAEFGLWFYYLELYAERLYEAETEDYRLFHSIKRYVLQESHGIFRYFAAKLLEDSLDKSWAVASRRNAIGEYGWKSQHLDIYIHDGTCPEAIKMVYRHLNLMTRLARKIMSEVPSIEIVNELKDEYKNDGLVLSNLERQEMKLRKEPGQSKVLGDSGHGGNVAE